MVEPSQGSLLRLKKLALSLGVKSEDDTDKLVSILNGFVELSEYHQRLFFNEIDSANVERLIKEKLQSRDKDNKTLFHHVVLSGNAAAVDLLLGRYRDLVDINALDINGKNPLNYAYQMQNDGLIKLLEKNGATLDVFGVGEGGKLTSEAVKAFKQAALKGAESNYTQKPVKDSKSKGFSLDDIAAEASPADVAKLRASHRKAAQERLEKDLEKTRRQEAYDKIRQKPLPTPPEVATTKNGIIFNPNKPLPTPPEPAKKVGLSATASAIAAKRVGKNGFPNAALKAAAGMSGFRYRKASEASVPKKPVKTEPVKTEPSTPLHKAVLSGDIAEVKKLIAGGADITKRDQGKNILETANSIADKTKKNEMLDYLHGLLGVGSDRKTQAQKLAGSSIAIMGEQAKSAGFVVNIMRSVARKIGLKAGGHNAPEFENKSNIDGQSNYKRWRFTGGRKERSLVISTAVMGGVVKNEDGSVKRDSQKVQEYYLDIKKLLEQGPVFQFDTKTNGGSKGANERNPEVDNKSNVYRFLSAMQDSLPEHVCNKGDIDIPGYEGFKAYTLLGDSGERQIAVMKYEFKGKPFYYSFFTNHYRDNQKETMSSHKTSGLVEYFRFMDAEMNEMNKVNPDAKSTFIASCNKGNNRSQAVMAMYLIYEHFKDSSLEQLNEYKYDPKDKNIQALVALTQVEVSANSKTSQNSQADNICQYTADLIANLKSLKQKEQGISPTTASRTVLTRSDSNKKSFVERFEHSRDTSPTRSV